jgi:hypothetical protein
VYSIVCMYDVMHVCHARLYSMYVCMYVCWQSEIGSDCKCLYVSLQDCIHADKYVRTHACVEKHRILTTM